MLATMRLSSQELEARMTMLSTMLTVHNGDNMIRLGDDCDNADEK